MAMDGPVEAIDPGGSRRGQKVDPGADVQGGDGIVGLDALEGVEDGEDPSVGDLVQLAGDPPPAVDITRIGAEIVQVAAKAAGARIAQPCGESQIAERSPTPAQGAVEDDSVARHRP